MAEFRTDDGGVLCEDLVRKVFEYDGHAEEARAACIAKGWGDVRRGPPWMIEAGVAKTTCVTISDDNSMLAVCNNFAYTYGLGGYRDGPPYDKHETVVYDVRQLSIHNGRRPLNDKYSRLNDPRESARESARDKLLLNK